MNVFFTADTHFGSKRTLELSKRPFKDVNEMDKHLIENWNDNVGKRDTVFHNGDFGNLDIIKKLNGNIVLLFGNYEREEFPINSPDDREMYKALFKDRYGIKVVFDKIHSGTYLKCDNEIQYSLLLSHEPVSGSPAIDVSNVVNLFGHIHKLCLIKTYGLNVGVDYHSFCPIDINTIRFYINAMSEYHDVNVFLRY